MYRFLALLLVFAAAACGGDDAAPETPTNTQPPATNTAAEGVAGARTASPTPSASPTPAGSYTVVDGDTLSEIAARFNTTVDALVSLNELANADEIAVGQVLKVSGSAATTTPGTATATTTTTTTPASN